MLTDGRRVWIVQGLLLVLFTFCIFRGLNVHEGKVSFLGKLAADHPAGDVWCQPSPQDEAQDAEVIAGFNGSEREPLPFPGGGNELLFKLGDAELLRCRSPTQIRSTVWNTLQKFVGILAGSEVLSPDEPSREPFFLHGANCGNATALWSVSRSQQTDAMVAILVEEGKSLNPDLHRLADMFTRSDGLLSACYPLSREAVFLLQKPRGAAMIYFWLLILPLIWRTVLRFSRDNESGVKDCGRDFTVLVINSAVCVYRYFVLFRIFNAIAPSFDFSDHVVLDMTILFIVSLDFAEMTNIFAYSSKKHRAWKLVGFVGFTSYFVACAATLAFIFYTAFFTAAFFHTTSEVAAGYAIGFVMIFCVYWQLTWFNRVKEHRM